MGDDRDRSRVDDDLALVLVEPSGYAKVSIRTETIGPL